MVRCSNKMILPELLIMLYLDICSDVNECERRTDDCVGNMNCINTNGTFICECKKGYIESESTCKGKTLKNMTACRSS